MTDVFISYASEDRERARKLAGELEARGWSAWWDRKIVAGQIFDEVIEREIGKAKSVVVLWSKHSVSSEWVKNEAAAAAERNVLVPALIDPVKLPLEFRRRQTVALVDWDGDSSHGGFKALCDGISANINGVAASQSITLPPSGFRWNRRWTLAAIAATAIALLGSILIASSVLPLNNPQPIKSDFALPNLAYGTWTLHNAIDDDGKNWSMSTLKFTSQEDTSDGLLLQGTFTWRTNFTLIGTERFTGRYLRSNRLVILEGDSVSNAPGSVIYSLTTGSYSAVVSLDERELLNGRWGSTMKHEAGVSGKWNATR